MKPATDRTVADNYFQSVTEWFDAFVRNCTKNRTPTINGAFRPLAVASFLRGRVSSVIAASTQQSKHAARYCNESASFLSFKATGQTYVDRSAEASEAVRRDALYNNIEAKTYCMGLEETKRRKHAPSVLSVVTSALFLGGRWIRKIS